MVVHSDFNFSSKKNFKKIRRLLLVLAYVFFLFIMKYYYENRLLSAKPALRFCWNFGSCIRRVIRGCMQNLKKIRRLLLPLAYVFFIFTMEYYYENRLISAKPALRFSWNLGSCNRRVIRGCVQNFKKIRRLLLSLAYVIIPILLQKYYKNRLISAKPALRFSWNLGSCNCRVIRGCVQNFKKIRRLLLPLAYVIIPILLQKYYKNT